MNTVAIADLPASAKLRLEDGSVTTFKHKILGLQVYSIGIQFNRNRSIYIYTYNSAKAGI